MIVTNVVHDKDRLSPVLNGWYYRFMKRLDHLKGDPIANIRMDCMTEETMTKNFNMLKLALEKHDLMNSPN